MAKQKKAYPKGVTPAGVMAFSYMEKPDDDGKFADNKYKYIHVVDADADLSKVEEVCKEAAKEKWGEVPADLQIPIRDGEDWGEKYDEFEGKKTLKLSSKYPPGFVDAKRNELPEGVYPKAGDLVKGSFVTYPYEKTEKVKIKEKGKTKEVMETTYGISLQLRNVQLLEKRSGSGTAAGDFEDEDDYEGISSKTASDNDKGDGVDDPDDF